MNTASSKGLPQRRSRSRLLYRFMTYLGMIVTLGATTLGGAEYFIYSYNHRADALRTQTFIRAEPPLDWTIEDGRAVDAYERAYDQCRLWAVDADEAPRSQLIAASRELQSRADADPPDVDVGPTCESAGFSALKTSRTRKYLTEDLCVKLVACQPAVEMLAEGTRRRYQSSTFQPWHERDPNPDKPLTLNRVVLVIGHLRGDRAEAAAIADLLRFGQDQGRGSSLLGKVVGGAIQSLAAHVLIVRVAEGRYDKETVLRLIRELRHVRRDPVNVLSMHEVEYLSLTPSLITRPYIQRRLRPPLQLGPGLAPENRYQELILAQLFVDRWRIQPALAKQAPFPARVEVYRELIAGYDDQPGHVRMIMVPALEGWRRHERELATIAEVLQVAYLALHVRRYRQQTGRWPTSLNDLDGEDIPTHSALTGRALTFEVAAGELTVVSDRSNLPPDSLPEVMDEFVTVPLQPADSMSGGI